MNLKRIISVTLSSFLLVNLFQPAICQTESVVPTVEPVIIPSPLPTISPIPSPVQVQEQKNIEIDSIKKYEEIIAPTPVLSPTPQEQLPENISSSSLSWLLPNLSDVLYQGWMLSESFTWKSGEAIPDYITIPEQVLNEIGLEEVLKQVYEKENHKAAILIYKFSSFTGAYSAYTILHRGNKSKLKVGRNATEAETLINFWKGNYYVDIHTAALNDAEARQLVTLASQDVSKNIKSEQMPPVVALQLPALNRIQGSEKYCFNLTCANQYLPKIDDIDYSVFNIERSGGVISAKYDLATLIFTRYTEKDGASSVFDILKAHFKEKAKENKEINIDESDSQIKIKSKKNGSISIKQKGNLLGVSQSLDDKKSSDKVLELIPWPVEIEKPTN